MFEVRVKAPKDGRVVTVGVMRVNDVCWFDAEALLDLFGYGADAELALMRVTGPDYVVTRRDDGQRVEHRRFVNIVQVGQLMRGSVWENDARRLLMEMCEELATRLDEPPVVHVG